MKMLPNASGGHIDSSILFGLTMSFLQAILLVLLVFSPLHARSLTFSLVQPHFSPQAATSSAGDRIALQATIFLLTEVITYVDLQGRCPQ
jgi:hypothetical protein